MEAKTILISLNPETMELDIEAPELTLGVAISLVQRAMRQLENMEKVEVAKQVSAAVREIASNDVLNKERTRRVLSNLKM